MRRAALLVLVPGLLGAALVVVACGGLVGNSGTDGGAAADLTATGSTDEPALLKGITAAHNAARASVNPPAATAIPPLTWSATVGQAAQTYADKCMYKHSGGIYGENIYATTGQSTPTTVVESWASEKSDYNYAGNSCSGVCGHYTQVVWAKSLRLGCGVASCTQNSPFGGGSWQLWVCNYDPPGNFNGQRPY